MKKWLLGLLFVAVAGFAFAQSDTEEDDDEWGENPAEEWVLEKRADVTIFLDDKEYKLGEIAEFERDKVLQVKIRFLRPDSWVAVHIEKAGMELKKHRFLSNGHGELDLEIKTGKRKIKGTATLFYTPSNDQKMEKKVKVQVL